MGVCAYNQSLFRESKHFSNVCFHYTSLASVHELSRAIFFYFHFYMYIYLEINRCTNFVFYFGSLILEDGASWKICGLCLELSSVLLSYQDRKTANCADKLSSFPY